MNNERNGKREENLLSGLVKMDEYTVFDRSTLSSVLPELSEDDFYGGGVGGQGLNPLRSFSPTKFSNLPV